MRFRSNRSAHGFRPLMGAVLTVSIGFILWGTLPGEPWVNASYDYLFLFGSRPVTNNLVLVLMDSGSYAAFDQNRDEPWDRALHARLLNKLADDGCAMVVMDSFFRIPRDPPASDEALAAAMRRQKSIVLMAEQTPVTHPNMVGAHPILPDPLFLEAARDNWGVAWLHPDLDGVVRRHWPFPSPGPYASLPWTAAELTGTKLSQGSVERWLRYYGAELPCPALSYRFAFLQPEGYFREKVVFIGTQPRTSVPGDEKDEFRTPYSRWTAESMGGVEIMATAYLNLLNGDWLERTPVWLEVAVLVLMGAGLGAGLCRLRPLPAGGVALACVLIITFAGVFLSYRWHWWFPWAVVCWGQVPFALAWALLMPAFHRVRDTITIASQTRQAPASAPPAPIIASRRADEIPETPDYELVQPPFGEGAYGKVWLARNAIGEWQALKAIYLSRFGHRTEPYERELRGIRHYKPISDKHPGLLRVDFVSRPRDGYFYYVMELGDSVEPGWQSEPAKYKPRDLNTLRAEFPGRRVPARECVRIGIELANALDFLHGQGLTHRDIKPQNVIFVNGRPKLADVGLTSEIERAGDERTLVGTPGYMPPHPEPPGTPQADIYALGMVLYVMATWRDAALFPELATTLVQSAEPDDLLPLNNVILSACAADQKRRFSSAAALREALESLPGSESKVF